MRPDSRPHKHPNARSRVPHKRSKGGRARAPRLETFLLQLSAAFLQMRSDAPPALIDAWLGKLAQLVGVDRISLWELSADGEAVYQRHSHAMPAMEQTPVSVPSRQFRWLTQEYRKGNIVVWPRVPDDIPEAAVAEREQSLRSGAKSLVGIPITTGSVLYVIVFASMRRYRKWPPALIHRLKLIGEVLAGAVMRQRVEAALYASEARNRAMLRALPDLMFVLSPAGIYLDHHTRDESKLLVPADHFLGRPIEEVLPVEVASVIRAAHRKALQSDEVVEVEFALQVQGEQREYEARMVRRDDGAIVTIVRNVTERRRSARKLRESEERFRAAFEHSAIGMALVSLEGRWLQANAANCKMLGYTETELLEMRFQALTHPDDLALNLRHLRGVLNGEIDHYELEKRYICKDGRTVPALLTVSVVRDAQRRPLYFLSQLQDLTERKKAQIEIERLRLELAHFGRLSLMGQLTASLAHQLMQPITAVMADAEACQRLMASGQGSPEEQQTILADIVSSCTRAAGVIDNVRGLLRKGTRPRHLLNLNRLVEEVIVVTHTELVLRQVRLVTRLDPSLPDIHGNPIELQQVILNLLLNGAEALSHGVADPRKLEIQTSHGAGKVEVTVRDGGRGVAPADLKRMFDPFFTTKPDGMGMGLTICAEIVRGHLGRLWAENNSGGGMTLHCELPLP